MIWRSTEKSIHNYRFHSNALFLFRIHSFRYAEKTCDECRQMAENLHRIELKSLQNVEIWHNVKLPDNHLSPQTTPKPKL